MPIDCHQDLRLNRRLLQRTTDRSPREVRIFVNDRPLTAISGESLAAALWAAGVLALRRDHAGSPRGMYCGIGHCYECRVTVNGIPDVRACLTPVQDGMHVLLDETPDGMGKSHEL